jgi:hypothetical protein
MERDRILATVKQHQPVLQNLDVQSLWVFGCITETKPTRLALI